MAFNQEIDHPVPRLLSDNESEQEKIETLVIQQDKQQTNKFLPKQSIQCILQPKTLENDDKMISFVELIDCFQANESFQLEIPTEVQLIVCQINNKFNIEDQCWNFCYNSKNSWQLIYKKAINYLQNQGINYLLMKKEFIQEYKQLFFENGKIQN